jgi:hypothetical protein
LADNVLKINFLSVEEFLDCDSTDANSFIQIEDSYISKSANFKNLSIENYVPDESYYDPSFLQNIKIERDTIFIPQKGLLGPVFILSKKSEILFFNSNIYSEEIELDLNHLQCITKNGDSKSFFKSQLSAFQIQKIRLFCETQKASSLSLNKKLVFIFESKSQINLLRRIRSAYPTEDLWIKFSNEIESTSDFRKTKFEARQFYFKTHSYPKGVKIMIKDLI